MKENRTNLKMTIGDKIFILSIINIIIGIIGYLIFKNHWVRYVFAHLGALGLIGLFAYVTGAIAKRKSFNYKNALIFGFFPSLVFGIIAPYLLDPPRENGLPTSCGGVVCIGIALIVIFSYSIAKKRTISE